MNAIRIITRIDSETLHLPDLKPVMGKTVEMIVLEAALPTACLETEATFFGLGAPEPAPEEHSAQDVQRVLQAREWQ